MTDKFLTVNQYSRPGKNLKGVQGIVLHWTGSPGQNAETVWAFFEKSCPHEKHYSSAHYIIDQDGTILHCIPDTEMAYHVGSSQIDPHSGKIYTELARFLFGEYARNPATLSPNQCTIGIEMCPIDGAGNFSAATLESAKFLVWLLMEKYGVPVERVVTHNQIVGWKDCPRLWVNHPEKFEVFKSELEART